LFVVGLLPVLFGCCTLRLCVVDLICWLRLYGCYIYFALYVYVVVVVVVRLFGFVVVVVAHTLLPVVCFVVCCLLFTPFTLLLRCSFYVGC